VFRAHPDHGSVRDHYLERCDGISLALPRFLATVSDARGSSYYSAAAVCGRLKMEPPDDAAVFHEALSDSLEESDRARKGSQLALTCRTEFRPPNGFGTRTGEAGSSRHWPSTRKR